MIYCCRCEMSLSNVCQLLNWIYRCRRLVLLKATRLSDSQCQLDWLWMAVLLPWWLIQDVPFLKVDGICSSPTVTPLKEKWSKMHGWKTILTLSIVMGGMEYTSMVTCFFFFSSLKCSKVLNDFNWQAWTGNPKRGFSVYPSSRGVSHWGSDHAHWYAELCVK